MEAANRNGMKWILDKLGKLSIDQKCGSQTYKFKIKCT